MDKKSSNKRIRMVRHTMRAGERKWNAPRRGLVFTRLRRESHEFGYKQYQRKFIKRFGQ